MEKPNDVVHVCSELDAAGKISLSIPKSMRFLKRKKNMLGNDNRCQTYSQVKILFLE